MAKLSLSDLTTILGNESSAVATLNANWALIETALENTVSRDGTTPNTFSNDLDLNSNDLLNGAVLNGTDGAFSGNVTVTGTLTVAGLPISGAGNVTITGTPLNNQVTVFTTATDVEGDPNLTWNGSALLATGVAPSFQLKETGVGITADNTLWRWIVDGEAMGFQLCSDAGTCAASYFLVQRTGNVCDSIAFTTTALTQTGTFGVTGQVTCDDSIKIKILSAAPTDTADHGQLWVRDGGAGVTDLMFTDEAGNDTEIVAGVA